MIETKNSFYLIRFGEKKITFGPLTIKTIMREIKIINKNLYFLNQRKFLCRSNKFKRDVTYINLSITQKTVTHAASTRNEDDKRKILHVNQCILTILVDKYRRVVE